MKHSSARSLLFAGGLMLFAAPVLTAQPAAGTPAPATAPKAATGAPAKVDRFERTKDHIDSMLKQRLNPAPLPPVLPNPFQSATNVPGTAGNPDELPTTPTEPEKPLTDDDEILAHYAATLKFSGQMMRDGQPHLIINSSPYKEGGLILVKGKDDVQYYLKVIRIAPNELTLGYNAAVLTLPLK